MLFVMLMVIGIIPILKIYADTCCYSPECPLPIFNQFTGNWTYLLEQNLMTGCCPSGGSFTINRYSDITSSCVCSRSQTCPVEPACRYWKSCPDTNFIGYNYNFSIGYISIDQIKYCTYTPSGLSTRVGMPQRCLVSPICYIWRYEGDIYAGTYWWNRLYNGFSAYKHEKYDAYIAVIDDWSKSNAVSKWAVSDGKPWGSRSFVYLSDPVDFQNITSIDGVEGGWCVSAITTTTTEYVSTTINPTNANMNSGSSNDNTVQNIVIVAVVVCVIVIVFFLGFMMWKNKKAKQSKNGAPYNLL